MSSSYTRQKRREILHRRAKRAYEKKKQERWKKYVTDEDSYLYKRIKFFENLGLSPSKEMIKEIRRIHKASKVVDLSDSITGVEPTSSKISQEVKCGRAQKRKRVKNSEPDDGLPNMHINGNDTTINYKSFSGERSMAGQAIFTMNHVSERNQGDASTKCIKRSIQENNIHTNCIYVPSNLSSLVSTTAKATAKESAFSAPHLRTVANAGLISTFSIPGCGPIMVSGAHATNNRSQAVYTLHCTTPVTYATPTSNLSSKNGDVARKGPTQTQSRSSCIFHSAKGNTSRVNDAKVPQDQSASIPFRIRALNETATVNQQNSFATGQVTQSIQEPNKAVNAILPNLNINSPISTLMLSETQLSKVLPSFIRVSGKPAGNCPQTFGNISSLASTRDTNTTPSNFKTKPTVTGLNYTALPHAMLSRDSVSPSQGGACQRIHSSSSPSTRDKSVNSKTPVSNPGRLSDERKELSPMLYKSGKRGVKGNELERNVANKRARCEGKSQRKPRREKHSANTKDTYNRKRRSSKETGINSFVQADENGNKMKEEPTSKVDKATSTEPNINGPSNCDKSVQTDGSLTDLLIAILRERGRTSC